MLGDGWLFGQDYGNLDEQWTPVEPRHLFGVASLIAHWKMVSFCGASFFMLGLLFAVIKPITYTASTQLLIYNRQLHSGPEPVVTPGAADVPLVENMIEIFRSPSVLTGVILALRLNQDAEFVSKGPGLSRTVSDWIVGQSAIADERRKRLERALE